MDYSVRPANENDINDIYELIRHYAEQGVILKRERNDILASIDNFIVAEYAGRIIGAVTFHDYGRNLKEVRSFVIEEDFHGKGIGSALLKQLIQKIQEKSMARIFTLTYKPDFFRRNGFIVVPKDDFPEKIWKDCRNCKDQDNCGETALVFEA